MFDEVANIVALVGLSSLVGLVSWLVRGYWDARQDRRSEEALALAKQKNAREEAAHDLDMRLKQKNLQSVESINAKFDELKSLIERTATVDPGAQGGLLAFLDTPQSPEKLLLDYAILSVAGRAGTIALEAASRLEKQLKRFYEERSSDTEQTLDEMHRWYVLTEDPASREVLTNEEARAELARIHRGGAEKLLPGEQLAFLREKVALMKLSAVAMALVHLPAWVTLEAEQNREPIDALIDRRVDELLNALDLEIDDFVSAIGKMRFADRADQNSG